MLPVAQLFARDIPGLRCRESADLLQVLWCLLDHGDGLPVTHLVWRSSQGVGAVLTDPPTPADVDEQASTFPNRCPPP